MIYIVLNVLPILLATCAGLCISAAVYWPRRGTVGPVTLAATAFIGEFWLCSILAGALILAPPKAGAWTMALGSAFVIWLGFVAPALIVTQRARAQAWRPIAADCAHWLAVMLAQALVLKSIGLIPPPV
ncbi:DUF1761 domain-containing protein [Novosphingobium sp. Chol11]|uniref:DUF1761 domain-containing protein n=1 Tax=Novosphingobium sp. Chol11 TaxID=1385763 RepID=UPI0025FB7DB6|nr:DUF1761 domain-containing protein [Novosphingobium sp. Chol11]